MKNIKKILYSQQDFDRFLILPTSLISIFFTQKAGKLNIFANLIQTGFLDAAIFLATDLTSYAQMISLWVFFVFVTTFCISFTRMEKY